MDALKILASKQERANINNNIRALMAEYEDKKMDQIKKDELAKLENEFDNLNLKIINGEKQLERDRITGEQIVDQRKPDATPDEKAKKLKDAFTNFLRTGDSHSREVYNALQQDNPTQAGYTVAPQKFMGEVIQDKNNLTFMRQIGNVLPPLEGAQSLGFPKRTARMSTFSWGTEIEAPTADSALAFGKREFKPKPATGGILVSKTLIRNTAINADNYVRTEMAYNGATNEEEAYMTGDGNNKPLGIFTSSIDGISTARDVSTGNTATEMKFDGLMEAKFLFPEQYLAGLSWIFHREGVKQIAKLKDGDGQYIWQQSVALGTPDILLGYPIKMSEYAPHVFTASCYVGILGNFKEGYWICDSLSMEIQALLELYALTNQVYFIGRYETDGMPVLEEAFARVKLGT